MAALAASAFCRATFSSLRRSSAAISRHLAASSRCATTACRAESALLPHMSFRLLAAVCERSRLLRSASVES
eukprot:3524526-Prymnesium_polylepis.1